MNKRRRLQFIFGLVMMSVLLIPVNNVRALSQEQLGAISQNCSTIKQTLKNLQRIDSKTRTYLGSTYEILATDFITPLNLRLVHNNRPEAELSSIQADFTTGQSDFKNLYTAYMREMETLTNTDCQSEPEKFYQQLELTRSRRQDLQQNGAKMLALIKKQLTVVEKIYGELK